MSRKRDSGVKPLPASTISSGRGLQATANCQCHTATRQFLPWLIECRSVSERGRGPSETRVSGVRSADNETRPRKVYPLTPGWGKSGKLPAFHSAFEKPYSRIPSSGGRPSVRSGPSDREGSVQTILTNTTSPIGANRQCDVCLRRLIPTSFVII